MTYKNALIEANTILARDPLVRFVGYGLQNGRAYGTLAHVDDCQIIETPIAENLMMGVAIGLALRGLRPVVFFERMDFILNAADAIVNHLDKIATLSHNEFNPSVVINAVVGNYRKPLYTGPVHTQDLSVAFRMMVGFPVMQLARENQIISCYNEAAKLLRAGTSTMLVTYKDLL